MELQEKIEKWLEDEKFVTFTNKRLKEEILHVSENHRLDPKHEELEEGFDNHDCYAAPLATYLTYRLQLAKYLVGICTSLYAGILHQSVRL